MYKKKFKVKKEVKLYYHKQIVYRLNWTGLDWNSVGLVMCVCSNPEDMLVT